METEGERGESVEGAGRTSAMLCVLVQYLQTCSCSSVLSLEEKGKKGGRKKGEEGGEGKSREEGKAATAADKGTQKSASKARAYVHTFWVSQTAAVASATPVLPARRISNFHSFSLWLLRRGRAWPPPSHPLHHIFS